MTTAGERDCEYEMGGPDGPVCAWAPGACKSWCRSNAASWAPTVLDIMDDVNSKTFEGFGIHIDVLDPDMFRGVLSCSTSLSEAEAEMHAETLESLGLSPGGCFGIGVVKGYRCHDLELSTTHMEESGILRRPKAREEGAIRCALNIAGLWKMLDEQTPDRTEMPSSKTVAAWNAWDFVTFSSEKRKTSSDSWTPKSLLVKQPRNGGGLYTIYHMSDPFLGTSLDEESEVLSMSKTILDRKMAIDAVARTMSDDLAYTRMFMSRLFYAFSCHTVPWIFGRRRALHTIFTVISKIMPEALQVTDVTPLLVKWTWAPMGPCTLPYCGNIHVSLNRSPHSQDGIAKEIDWGSVLKCVFEIDLNPLMYSTRVKITVITSW